MYKPDLTAVKKIGLEIGGSFEVYSDLNFNSATFKIQCLIGSYKPIKLQAKCKFS